MKYDYPFSTNIVKYLHLLSNGNTDTYKMIEQKLKKKLEYSNCSLHKYKRYKTDRDKKTTLSLEEGKVLFEFFQDEFKSQIDILEVDSIRWKELRLWQPIVVFDLYHYPSPLAA